MTVIAGLDELFIELHKMPIDGDAILFSPGGSSFDQYKNYKERGDHFKRLVAEYSAKKASSDSA
jgi:UDP-N-acetylmuramoylalanine--D-glutamate ligase